MSWWEAFALWKTVVVVVQLHRRWVRGESIDPRMAHIADRAPSLVAAAQLVLDAADVTRVVARSVEPLLEPELREERTGIVPNVVFPTALEPVQDNESPDYHVFYGMADARIGVARLRMQGKASRAGPVAQAE